MVDPHGDMPLRLLLEHQQSAQGPALPALSLSEMASLCLSKPDLVTLDLESSKPFSAWNDSFGCTYQSMTEGYLKGQEPAGQHCSRMPCKATLKWSMQALSALSSSERHGGKPGVSLEPRELEYRDGYAESRKNMEDACVLVLFMPGTQV